MQRAVVGLVLGLLVLAGCGDDDETGASGADESPAQVDESPDSDATTGTAGADGFCDQVQAAEAQLEAATDDTTLDDPQEATEAFRDAVDELGAIEPPQEIADDWTALVGAMESLAAAMEGLDLSDPEATADQLEELEQQLEEDSAALEEAGSRIDAYLSEECGIAID